MRSESGRDQLTTEKAKKGPKWKEVVRANLALTS